MEKGLIPVKNDGKLGVINKKGQLITECIYDEVEYFTEDGIAKVKKDGKYGFINGNGKMVGVVNQQELF